MKTLAWLLLAWLTVPASFARADDLVAQHPGLMCVDPKGLAQLTLPDGSSKLSTARASKADRDLAFVSQCVNIPAGARLPMGERHRQTSQVYYEAKSGPAVFTAPNIDFSDPVPSAPGEKPFAELRLHAAGFDLKFNQQLGLTCQPAEYVHGLGMVLDCTVGAPRTVAAAGPGIPDAIPCAAGAVQLLPDGAFRECKLAGPVPYTDFKHHNQTCPPGRTLARDMSGNEPEPTADCS